MGTDQRAQVWAKTDGHCWYCGKQMNPWDDFTVDHMDSRKQGGGDELPNLIPACKSCNSRKHAKTVEEYRGYLIEKKHYQFWGEQAYATILPTVIAETAPEAPAAWEPTVGALQELIYYITERRDYAPNRTSVLLALIFQAYLWREKKGELTNIQACAGSTTMHTLVQLTGLAPEAVIGGLLWLQEHEWLALTMPMPPEREYDFFLWIAEYLDWGLYVEDDEKRD